MKNQQSLFLTLKVFQATGGIEKVCRIVGKAMYEDAVISGRKMQVISMYDKNEDAIDNPYFPSENFMGFRKKKWLFVLSSIFRARKSQTILMSHINLLVIGWIIKKIFPKKKIILLAHGIEIWSKLPSWRKYMLKSCDQICSVSHFTKGKVLDVHQIDHSKNLVLNNCIDPFLPTGIEYTREGALREKWNLSKQDIVLFTLSRLSSRERYKGYDQVVLCLPEVLKTNSSIKYVIGGMYDAEEKNYLEKIARQAGVLDKIILTGFIPETDLVSYFKMADMYVMPSMKEGFGIVFVEAMYYGLPVIAGNKDGSVDALRGGELGILVNPENKSELVEAIRAILNDKIKYTPDKNELMEHFGFESYKRKLEALVWN